MATTKRTVKWILPKTKPSSLKNIRTMSKARLIASAKRITLASKYFLDEKINAKY